MVKEVYVSIFTHADLILDLMLLGIDIIGDTVTVDTENGIVYRPPIDQTVILSLKDNPQLERLFHIN